MSLPLVPIKRFPGKHYAIELKETRYKEIRDSDTNFEITFHWESVIENIKPSIADLTIELTKANPRFSNQEIKNLSRAITDTRTISERDIVFGLYNKKIRKVGFVKEKQIFENTIVAVDIRWIDDYGIRQVSSDIFQDNDEIQRLNIKQLKIIEMEYGRENLQRIYDRIPLRDFLGPDIKLIERNEYLEEMQFSKQEPGGKIRLFYGTSRNPLTKKDGKQTYGNTFSELEVGICEVTIPRGHIQGDMERPGDYWIIKFKENADMHIMVQTVQPLEHNTFMRYFSQTVKNTPKKSALLFVHGYNNSFEDAARRSAQIAYDLPFDGFAGFFSWPSDAKAPFYFSDESAARSTPPALVEFLENLIADPELEQLHIIAHSMGSLVTTLSLNNLRTAGNASQYLHKIHQLILGAPDIDQEEFRNTILPGFKNIGLRRTVYASDHDFALRLSSAFRIGRFRLGQTNESVFLDQDLDTIEASSLISHSSHGYLFESKILLSDLFFLINENLSPAQRRLREVKVKLLKYWLFPK